MKRYGLAATILVLAYLATGFFIVKGNEKAVVRRCGRLVSTESGTARLISGGLHYDLPWPFAAVSRIRLNEVRTLSIGMAGGDDIEENAFLQPVGTARRSQFLTGDNNILDVQITVQYRIAESATAEFLFASESVEDRLQLLIESIAADLISRSGVDFVHPLGLGELREMLTANARRSVEERKLGVEIEEVAISAVNPPIRVKSYFLDVANARADRQKYVNAALAYQLRRQQTARGESRRVRDEAEIFRQNAVESARGRAESFTKLLDQFEREETDGVQSYAAARQMALRREYVDVMQDVLRRVASKVFLDSGKPVDLTIFRDPKD
jgi:membrane protease subunit HflK